jgi:hypothetical protein
MSKVLCMEILGSAIARPLRLLAGHSEVCSTRKSSLRILEYKGMETELIV